MWCLAITRYLVHIFEKLMAKRLRFFLEDRKILCPNQHGFRPKHSTTSATTSYLRYIYDNLELNHNTYSMFLDYSKAFDTHIPCY